MKFHIPSISSRIPVVISEKIVRDKHNAYGQDPHLPPISHQLLSLPLREFVCLLLRHATVA